MNLETAIMSLEFNLDHDIPSMMISSPGVGKSSIVHQIAERRRSSGKRFGLIDFRASTRDPVALMGLPDLTESTTQWKAPDEFPQVARDGDEGILFLDELNAASPTMQAACFGLVLDRKVGNYIMPKGWRIVAAGNHQSDRAAAQKMPTALVNRFNMIYIEHDVPTFAKYAIDVGLPPELIAFIRFRPALLHKMEGSDGKPFPTPRSWEQASKMIAAPAAIRLQLMGGSVGDAAAGEFEGFLRVYQSLPSIDSVIMDPDGAVVPGENEVSARFAIVSALASKALPNNFDNIMRYANRMPREFATMLVVDATRRDTALTHTSAFAQWALKNKDVTM